MKKKFLIIDGSNCVFRAFYALPILTNSKGEPTNALLGFSQMLIKLINDEKPEYIVVVFDTKEPTFRDDIYKEYKANRKEPPEELVPQFPHFPRIVEAMGIKNISKPGFEADDIIGTLAKKYSSDEIDIVIVSSDKDMFQLVNENVSVLDSMKKKLYGAKEVEEKIGVLPDKITDVFALAGDSSDNIPGVRGVGIKTAVKIINEYGSFDNVFKNVDKMKGALKVKLENNIEMAMTSKKLVEIDTNVSISEDINDFRFCCFNKSDLINIFREFEFNRLVDSLTSFN